MKKFIIILLAVAALGITGCEKWLNINQNPNDATKATPDLILPGVLTNWLGDVQGMGVVPTGIWMGYWSNAGGWSGWYSEKKYEITSNYANYYGYYTGQLTDNRFIRDNSGDNVIYPAITNVTDAWYYSRLVDLYGDVPYSEACKPEVTLTPKYDDAKTIYLDLITRLDTAIFRFDRAVNAPDAATNAIYTFKKSVDVIFTGDFTKWMKFANTLKLRLVMRLTNVMTPVQLAALMANTQAKGFITATVTGNPGFSASSGKTNPWWNSFGKSYDGIVQNNNTEYCLNAYMHRKLALLSDPRLLKYFFAPASAVPAGSIISMQFGTDGNLVVQPNTTVVANYSWLFIANDWAVVANKNTGNGALDPCPIFLLSEALFLQAEAAQRAIITTTTASAAYTAGITASLVASKVIAADQTAYLAQAGVAWDATWTPAQQIERIINQKWIANYFLNFFEAWNDYRRTGYPNPLHPGYAVDATDPSYSMISIYPGGRIRNQIPRIIPYPQADLDINKVQVQAAIDKQIAAHGVTFTTSSWPFDARVFWDTAPATITY